MTPIRPLPSLVAALLLLGLAACAPPTAEQAEAPPAPERVELPAMGLVIADLPPSFAVVSTGETAVLAPAGERPGELVVEVAPPDAGVNLVETVKAHRAGFAERPGGEYGGQRELGTPYGTAFYSRGRWDAEGGVRKEEVRIFTLHPLQRERQLVLTYTYPVAEDTPARLEEMLTLLGEIEPFEQPVGDAGETAAGDGAPPAGG